MDAFADDGLREMRSELLRGSTEPSGPVYFGRVSLESGEER